MGKRNIVLVGFMGTGKTTVGKLLAKDLSLPFIDTDFCIERNTAMTVSEIFENQGEKYFRELEKKLIKEISEGEGCVVAAGGGAVIFKENVENFQKNGLIVALTADIDTILARTSSEKSRPLLLASMESVAKLYQERYPIYQGAADLIIDTSILRPEEVRDLILQSLVIGH